MYKKILIGIDSSEHAMKAVAKAIELHKGKIWAISEGRHKGTKFCFTLPIL